MKIKCLLWTAFLLLMVIVESRAQVTNFTYQGRLDDAGSAANGVYDFEFSLFGVAGGGVAVAGPLPRNGVTVSNGLFTVVLDFDSSAFAGAARWLDIGVRTNGGGGFSALSPRTEITAAPYAIYSGTAELAANVPNNSIGTAQIVAGGVQSSDILDGTITSADIANGSIGTSDLNLASVDARYVLKAGDIMTGKLTAQGGIATSSITNDFGILSLKSRTDIELQIDNGGGAAAAFEIFNGLGEHLYILGETGNARTFGNHVVNGSVGIGTVAPDDTLHVFDSGNEGDIMVENTFPFITLNQSIAGNNAGLLFTGPTGNNGWLLYRGSDQAITMGSTTANGSPNTLVLQRDGNAGIGTSSAFTRLTVNGTIGFESPSTPAMYIFESGSLNGVKPLFVHSPSFPTWGLFYDDSGDEFVIGSTTTNDPALVVSAGGDWVAINTSTPKPGYELSVDGQIVCEELLVENSADWPDYVFEENYPLRSLSEVETHIKEKKHLPGIPTAAEVKRDGLPIGEMQKRMMEKIEELTLYVIAQDKRLAAQEKQILNLQSQLEEQ